MPSTTAIQGETAPIDIKVISSDDEDVMQVDENNNQTDDYFPADNEVSESESEALKTEDMPQMEEFSSRVDESAPASDADSDRLIIDE